MFVSVIVPAYKDVRALELILEGFNRQTYRDFEVVVAEDDESPEISAMLSRFDATFPLKHFHHPDVGSTTKPTAVNSAVRISDGEYLVYIDGDTIPYSTFLDAHVKLAAKKRALCGRRVNLDAETSEAIRAGKLDPAELEHHYLRSAWRLLRSGTDHYEQGVYLRPGSFLQRKLAERNRNLHLLGSNFSCWREDMLAINGSDEDMPPGAGTDDVDIEWRLQAVGVEIYSCKNCANLFHLHHERNDNRSERTIRNKQIIEEKKARNDYRCTNGIVKA